MAKFDHLAIFVGDRLTAAHWYTTHLGLEIEFELPEAGVTAVRDEADFTIFLTEGVTHAVVSACVLWFQVADVDSTYQELSLQGVSFSHAPRPNPWGYGAELLDPDGHIVRLWDQRSMDAHMEAT
jgi:catechol 2,3-dioxygenase-like lactoylglutathione lyase family enzyme